MFACFFWFYVCWLVKIFGLFLCVCESWLTSQVEMPAGCVCVCVTREKKTQCKKKTIEKKKERRVISHSGLFDRRSLSLSLSISTPIYYILVEKSKTKESSE